MDTATRQIHNFQAGDLFDRHYRLLEHVGSGGFADVWRAKDELVDTIVALKIYTRLDKEGISELAKEYKEMRGIKHPNLLTGNHFDASGNIPYLEMDYCDGGSLYGKLGRLGNDELRHVLRDIAGGLAYLHREGIVHQDIKPENILYDTVKDRYLLSDFGISGKSRTRLSHSMTMNQMTYSMTEAYAPPEKFSGNVNDLVPDTKGDIFSLGMTLFELATGMLPFTPPMATGREMLYSQGRLQLDYGQIKDPVLRSVVEGCTRYDKTQRITAEEILATLNGERPASKTKTTGTTSTVGGLTPTVEVKIDRGGVQPPPPTPTPNRKWIYVVLVAVVVTMGMTLTLLTGHSSDEGIGDNTRLVEHFETVNGLWTGSIVDGQPDGKGVLNYHDNDRDGRLRYEGAMRQGRREDSDALLVYRNGSSYRGSFVNDQFSDGKLSLKDDGMYYIGQFRDGEPYSGTWYWDNGTVYSSVVNGVEK